MSPISKIAGLGGLAALLSVGATAADQQHPLYLPTRDVAVTYALDHQGPGPIRQAQIFYSASAGKLRLETPGPKRIYIIDRPGKTTTVLMPREHVYVELPLDPNFGAGFLLNKDMSFVRGDSETIAGQKCTDWQVETPVVVGTVCVTDDGVLLLSRGKRKQGAGEGGLQAVEVSYDPQPAALFVPPAEFRKVDMSELAGILSR